MVGPGECCERENVLIRKRKWMSSELMELHDKELDYIIFGYKMVSDDGSNDSDEDFVL